MPDVDTNPLSGLTTDQELGVLGQTWQGYKDWWASGPLNQSTPGTGLLSPLALRQLASNVGSGFAGSITGFHGTPHTFEPVEGNPFGEFRDSAIGSGEGAQVYGYGHYVAGNPAVAEDYVKQLAKPVVSYKGEPVSPAISTPYHAGLPDPTAPVDPTERAISKIANRIISGADNPEAAMASHMAFIDQRLGQDKWQPAWPQLQAEKEAASKIDPNDFSVEKLGNLLEIHIKPDESELLDWDRPLSQQGDVGQKALGVMAQHLNGLGDLQRAPDINKISGEGFYNWLTLQKSKLDPDNPVWGDEPDKQASDALHSAGIPGIKYLDQGSRVAATTTGQDIAQLQSAIASHQQGLKQVQDDLEANKNNSNLLPAYFTSRQEQASALQAQIDQWQSRVSDLQAGKHLTRNYVIFHPSNLSITARNGQRLEPVDHDPFQTTATPVDHDPFVETPP
jgi:hypothetical protein